METLAFIFIFSLIVFVFGILFFFMKLLSFMGKMWNETTYTVSEIASFVPKKTTVIDSIPSANSHSTIKEAVEQHARRVTVNSKYRFSEVLPKALIGNTIPHKFREINTDINKLFLKINEKQELLDIEKTHRLDTLEQDYQALLSMYFGYDKQDRIHFEDFFAEGLVGLQTKLESIYSYIINHGKSRMKHRVEVINRR